MTLPAAKKFPKPPEGYFFRLSLDGVDTRAQENAYTIEVLDVKTGNSILPPTRVAEPYLLETAERLSGMALLIAETEKTQDQVQQLNQTFRENAAR
jgi:hypothetical protein